MIQDNGAKLALDRILGNTQEELLNGVQKPNTMTPQPIQLPMSRVLPPRPPQDMGGTLPMSRKLPVMLPGQETPEWEKPEGDRTITPAGQKIIGAAAGVSAAMAYPATSTGMGIWSGAKALQQPAGRVGKNEPQAMPEMQINANKMSQVGYGGEYLPGGAKHEEYQELPLYTRFALELPALIATGVAYSATPGASGMSQMLEETARGEGNKAILAQMGQSALAPMVAVEEISGKILNAIFGKPMGWITKQFGSKPAQWTDEQFSDYLAEKAFKGSPIFKELQSHGITDPKLERELLRAFKFQGTNEGKATEILNNVYQAYPTLRPDPSGTKALTLYEGLKFTPQEQQLINNLPIVRTVIGATKDAPEPVVQGMAILTQAIVKGEMPANAVTSAVVKSYVPEGLTITSSLVNQLMTQGFSQQAISQMSPDRAWASLFQQPMAGGLPKGAGQPPLIPPEVPPTEVVAPEEPRDFYKEAITGLNETAKIARTARPQQAAERRTELAKRTGIAADLLAEGRGEQAFKNARTALRGRLSEEQFTPLSETFTQGHLDALNDKIRESNLLPLTKIATQDVLNKLLYTGQVPTDLEYQKLQAVFGTDLDTLIEAKRSTGSKVWRNIVELLNFPRSIATSFDNSIPMRQTGFQFLGEPEKYAWPILKDSYASMASGKYASEAYQKVTEMPRYPWMVEGNLKITNPDSRIRLAGQEDIFVSKFLKNIPVIGQGVKMTERGAIAALNSARSNMASNLMDLADDQGLLDADVAREICKAVNILTGSGTGKILNQVAPLLNSILFSVKYQGSIMQTIPLMFDPKLPRSIRFGINKQFGRWIIATSAIVGALTIALGDKADIEFDPRSTDFGKLRFGNTRFDLQKGFLGYLRFAAQLITGTRKLETGEIQEAPRTDQVFNFLRGKTAPSTSVLWDILAGSMYGGEDMTVTKELYNRMLPLVYQDMWEAFKEDGLIGLALAAPSFMGGNVNTYASKEVEDWRKNVETVMGENYLADRQQQFTADYQEQLSSWVDYFKIPPKQETNVGVDDRTVFLREHPEVDASMLFWGHKRSLESPQAWAIVQEMLQKYELPVIVLPESVVKKYTPKPTAPAASGASGSRWKWTPPR